MSYHKMVLFNNYICKHSLTEHEMIVSVRNFQLGIFEMLTCLPLGLYRIDQVINGFENLELTLIEVQVFRN